MMERKRDVAESAHDNAAHRAGPKKSQVRKKLGGGGLSLEAFAAAKSKPFFKPAEIREHQEFYRNAKKVQKYKKLVKQLGGQGQGPQSDVDKVAKAHTKEEDGEITYDDSSSKIVISSFDKTQGNNRQKGKSIPHLERIREEHEKDKLEKQQKRKEREELYLEQQEAREIAFRGRKEVRARLRKKTQRGQPVMKHRMEQLLKAIQQGG